MWEDQQLDRLIFEQVVAVVLQRSITDVMGEQLASNLKKRTVVADPRFLPETVQPLKLTNRAARTNSTRTSPRLCVADAVALAILLAAQPLKKQEVKLNAT